MEDTPFGLGGEPSPLDYRDDLARTAAVSAAQQKNEPPIVLDLSQFPVLMQGQRPACVSHAVALLLQVYWFIKTGKIIYFSPRFLDALVKTIDGLPLEGTGAYPRYVMKMAATYGCATVDALPNDTTLSDTDYRNPKILTPEVMANALPYKIPGYVSVATDVSSSREGMRLFGPLAMLMQIGQEWWTNTSGISDWSPAGILPLRTPAKIVSGHEIVRHASEDSALDTLRNSWSDAWGQKGDGTFHPASWNPFINEQWAVAEIPADAKDLLSNLPAPADFHFTWNADMKYGDITDDVKFAQIALLILGYLKGVAPEDLGHYGPKTAAAVQNYQTAKGIRPTALNNIGPRTRAALNSQFAL